jgi:Domain of unknown function (DUF222)
MSSGAVVEAIAAMRAAYDAVADLPVDTLTHPEILSVLQELETLNRQLPTQSHRLLARLQREASPTALGARTLREVLTARLRISSAEARRRLGEAADLGPRVALSGEPQEPVLAKVATAQADGAIGTGHVEVIRRFFAHLPGWVDPTTRQQCETTLVAVAVGLAPDELRTAAERLLALIDQDGPQPDDAERARKRHLVVGRQRPDGMVPIRGELDPLAWASLEPIFAKLAAPGMCNPDDEHPCIKGTPSQAQIEGDHRSVGQRQHDALTAVARAALSSGELGQHNGLPATIIVKTTLQELQAGAGGGVTAGGALLPMADLIRLASHAHHYLTVFDRHTNEVLYAGRSKRIAPAAHRIVLLARDGGCTKPGCTVPGYGTQVHHTRGWARNGGQTNVDEEVLACRGDNLLAELGWTVTIGPHGVEWIPPPELDVGQARINHYHHPDRLLTEP